MALTHTGRPEQLVLQDDPSFLPEFTLPPPELLADLDLGFDLGPPRSGESQSLTPFGSQQSSRSSHVAGFGLVLPSSSPNRSAGIGIQGDDGLQGGSGVLDAEDLLQLDEPDFTFGEDGDLIDFTTGQHAPATPAAGEGVSMHSDAGASARVRREHEEGRHAGDQVSVAAISYPDSHHKSLCFASSSLTSIHASLTMLTHRALPGCIGLSSAVPSILNGRSDCIILHSYFSSVHDPNSTFSARPFLTCSRLLSATRWTWIYLHTEMMCWTLWPLHQPTNKSPVSTRKSLTLLLRSLHPCAARSEQLRPYHMTE